MCGIAVVAAVAEIVGVGAYLNGRYHVAKDLKAMYAAKVGQRRYEDAGMIHFFPFHLVSSTRKNLTKYSSTDQESQHTQVLPYPSLSPTQRALYMDTKPFIHLVTILDHGESLCSLLPFSRYCEK